ncbi:MAG: oligosaccharide flippase family protein [Candidatus Bathyarchaeota archaeon]|jgi:O-antigen/teichoic acid export membrane protein
MGSSITQVAKGSAYLAIQGVAITLIGAVAMAFRARILTQTEMGIAVALTLVIGLSQILSDLGFSRGLAKHIAEHKGRNASYTHVLSSGFMVKVLLASFAGLLCVTTAPQLSKLLLRSDAYTALFQLTSIDVILVCINFTTMNLLLGLGKVPAMATLNLVRGLIRYSSMIAFLLLGYALPGLIVGWILGELAYAIPSITIAFKGKNLKVHSIQETTSYLKQLARFSWPLFLTNIVVFLYNWFDRAVLLAYLPLTDVAIYDVAFMAFGVIYMVPTALGTTLFPYYTEQYGRNKHENIAIGARSASRYIALIFTPLTLGLAITANPAIRLFAGPAYVSGDVVLFILSLFAGISSLGAALGGLLLVYDMTRTVFGINIVSAGLSIAMSLLLLPFIGVVGIALVRGVAMVLSFVLTFLAVRRHTPIEFDKKTIGRSWVASVTMLVAVGLAQQVYVSYYLLPLLILLGAIVYTTTLRFLKAVDENDIELVRKLLGNRATPLVHILRKLLL